MSPHCKKRYSSMPSLKKNTMFNGTNFTQTIFFSGAPLPPKDIRFFVSSEQQRMSLIYPDLGFWYCKFESFYRWINLSDNNACRWEEGCGFWKKKLKKFFVIKNFCSFWKNTVNSLIPPPPLAFSCIFPQAFWTKFPEISGNI